MANVFIEENTMTAIGNAIRAKTGGSELILPADMPEEIASITTGGGSGGGSIEGGLPFAKVVYGMDQTTSVGIEKTVSVSISIPENAIIYGFYFDFKVVAYSDKLANLGEVARKTILNEKTTQTETQINTKTNQKTVYFFKEKYLVTDAYLYSISSPAYTGAPIGWVFGIIPDIYIKDNILCAKPECTSILADTATPNIGNGYYYEGIDMRGSQVKTLPYYWGVQHPDLKKIWFSEVCTEIPWFSGCPSGLEEVHFTTATPPSNGSTLGSYIPTTCKIYVPAGSLEAYKSAANYPDPNVYQYIEE